MRGSWSLWMLLVVAVSTTSFAEVPRSISYQGILKDESGYPVSDGSYEMTFGLYTSQSGGDPDWQETQTVEVEYGIFNAILGDVVPIDLLFDAPYWLGVSVGDDPELEPRIPLVTSPYTFRAAVADSAVGAVTSVEAGEGLSGGGSGGSLTLSIADAGVTEGKLADDSVTGMKIADDAIAFRHIGDNAATPGQVMKWNGADWIPDNDYGVAGPIAAIVADEGLAGGGDHGEIHLQIAPEGVQQHMLAEGAVTGSKLADEAVGNAALGAAAVTNEKLSLDAVDSPNLMNDAITSAKIGPGQVQNNDLGHQAVSGDKIADGTVGTSDLQDGSVTSAKIANLTIDTVDLKDGLVTGVKLAASAVDSSKLGANAVTSAKISDGAVEKDDLNSDSVDSAKIEDSSIATGDLADSSITSVKILDGSILFHDIAPNGASAGQVMKYDGLAWTAASDSVGGGGDITAVTAGDGLDGGGTSGDVELDVLYGGTGSAATVARSDHDHDDDYVNSNEADAITSVMIVAAAVDSSKIEDASIAFEDINQSGATVGQVMKWDGSAWVADNDNTGAGGSSGWAHVGSVVSLETSTDSVGIGIASPSAKLDVVGDLVTRGKMTIGPGHQNSGAYSFVAGDSNIARQDYAVIGGGRFHDLDGAYSVIGGGGGEDFEDGNRINASHAVIAGGRANFAMNEGATVGGGGHNHAEGAYSVVAGGGTWEDGGPYPGGNRAFGSYAVISGGNSNRAGDSESDQYATIGGGYANRTRGYATVAGGAGNEATGLYSVISGGGGDILGGPEGGGNRAEGDYAVIGGGSLNLARGRFAVIGGGGGLHPEPDSANYAEGDHSVIGGGSANRAGSEELGEPEDHYRFITIGGGFRNEALIRGATIGGGGENFIGPEDPYGPAYGEYATIGGGRGNRATGRYAVVGGGGSEIPPGPGNRALGLHAVISGGADNLAGTEGEILPEEDFAYATVGGGAHNEALTRATTIGGGFGNSAGPLSPGDPSEGQYATVAGGGFNRARGNFSFVGGGGALMDEDANQALGDYSVVTGGAENQAGTGPPDSPPDGEYSTVGGGRSNTALGRYAFIPGGRDNIASGGYSAAIGHLARAHHDGSIVISATNSTDVDDSVSTSIDGQMVLRVDAGFYLTRQEGQAPNQNHFLQTSTGAYLTISGQWTSVSDRNLKGDFQEIDRARLLRRVAELPVQEWSFKSEDPRIRHVGPVAQDFRAAFGLGNDDTTISPLDVGGISLAAIQELYLRSRESDRRIEQLMARIEELEGQLRFQNSTPDR